MSVQEMAGAVISRRMLAEQIARDNGLGELTSPDEPPRPGGVLVTLADVVAERVGWLWPGRLPAGKLVTLDGDPALGKSTLAITLAAHLSTGRSWPDGTPCPLADVIILSTEDGMADTIRPRLDAAGGNPARVHCLTEVRAVNEDGDPTTRPPNLGDITQIRESIDRTKARLLVIDVLMAYMPGKVDSHRDQDVRAVLHRIAEVADATSCTVLLLRHLNKSGAGSPMYRGGGSIGIVGAARAGYVVAPDPDDDTGATRVLACVKSNLAEQPPSLTYRLESAPGSHVARVVWGAASPHSATDLLRTGSPEERDSRSEMDAWLLGYLTEHGGVAPARDIYRDGQRDGYSTDQLKRAKARLKIIAEKAGMSGGWSWRHPDDRVDRPEGSTKGAKSAALITPHSSLPSVLPSVLPSGETTEGERSWLPTSAATGATPHPDTRPPVEPVADSASPSTVSTSPADAASTKPGSPSSNSATSGAEADPSGIPPKLRAAMDILSRDLNATLINTDSWQHLATGYDT